MRELDALCVPDPEHRFAWLPPRVEYIDGVEWKLMNIVQYRTAAGEVSTVKRGFIFDFASVPRPLAWLYPAAGDGSNHYGIAALFHDWLYAHRKIKDRPITRREADAIFYEIMRYVGCRRTLAWTMWLAVRTGGWLPWARRKPHEVIP